MTLSHFLERNSEGAEGQATFEMANLRPQKTGLPIVVFVSQKDGAQHDIRVKVSSSPKTLLSQIGTYAVRPFRHIGGPQLDSKTEALLEAWVTKNQHVLVAYWDGVIQYTDEMLEQIEPIQP